MFDSQSPPPRLLKNTNHLKKKITKNTIKIPKHFNKNPRKLLTAVSNCRIQLLSTRHFHHNLETFSKRNLHALPASVWYLLALHAHCALLNIHVGTRRWKLPQVFRKKLK